MKGKIDKIKKLRYREVNTKYNEEKNEKKTSPLFHFQSLPRILWNASFDSASIDLCHCYQRWRSWGLKCFPNHRGTLRFVQPSFGVSSWRAPAHCSSWQNSWRVGSGMDFSMVAESFLKSVRSAGAFRILSSLPSNRPEVCCFWSFLYFCVGNDVGKLQRMDQ